MDNKILKELKLLGSAEELVIRRHGEHLIIRRLLRLPSGVRSAVTELSFVRLEYANFDLLAEEIGKQRDAIRSPELQVITDLNSLGVMQLEKGEVSE